MSTFGDMDSTSVTSLDQRDYYPDMSLYSPLSDHRPTEQDSACRHEQDGAMEVDLMDMPALQPPPQAGQPSYPVPCLQLLLDDTEDVDLRHLQLQPESNLRSVVQLRSEDAQASGTSMCSSTLNLNDLKAPFLSQESSDNLDLALATVKAIEDGTPVDTKKELRNLIGRRKTTSCCTDVTEPPSEADTTLSEVDRDRKERRKASNRKAARKCREKKIKEQNEVVQAKEKAEEKLQKLRLENQQLRSLLSRCTCQHLQQHLQQSLP